jgi:transcriptional regulator with GAF, ATPase, and Fis domain
VLVPTFADVDEATAQAQPPTAGRRIIVKQQPTMDHSDTPTRPSSAGSPDPATAFASLSGLVYAARPLADTLQRMSVLATQVLDEAPEVSLTLIEREQGFTAATSGPVALDLDTRQYDDGDGPCLDAARYGQTVRLTVDAADQPYRDLRHAAQQKGVTHTVSIGLPTGDQVMGAMNIYTFTGRPLSEKSEQIARTFAVCIGIVLGNAEQHRQAAARAAGLEVALQTRAPIEQAKGILMARHHCTSEEAFAMLIRLSQSMHVKIRDIAQNLVDQVH